MKKALYKKKNGNGGVAELLNGTLERRRGAAWEHRACGLKSDTPKRKWVHLGAIGKLLLAVLFLVRRRENAWAKSGKKSGLLLTADRSTTELLWIIPPAD